MIVVVLVDMDEALIGFGETMRSARRQYMARVRAALEEGAPNQLP